MAELVELLSDRELDVMRLVATGATNQEIARRLDISPNTVKVHLRNVYEKLGVASRYEATLVLMREGTIVVEGVNDDPTPPTLSLPDEAMVEILPPPEPLGVATESAPAVTPSPPIPSGDDGEVLPQSGAESIPMVPDAPQRIERLPEALPPAIAPPLSAGDGRRSPLVLGLAALVGLLLVALLVLGWRLNQTGRGVMPTSQAEVPTVVRWSELPPLPQPRAGAAAAVYSGQLYVVGGHDESAPIAPLGRFDPAAGAWNAGPAKPLPVSRVGAAFLGGRLIVPGGELSNGAVVREVEAFDVRSGSWGSLAPLPRPLSRYALAELEGRLYLFGGWDGERVRDEILVYTPDDDQWQEAGRLPAPRTDSAAAALNDALYLVGGRGADAALLASVLVFRPDGGLTDGPALPQAMADASVAAVGNNLYLIGNEGGWRLDSIEGEWRPFEEAPPATWSAGSLVSLGSDLLTVGGRATPEAHVWRYQALFRVYIPVAPDRVTP